MSIFPKRILRWPATIVFMTVIPAFYLAFIIVYYPFNAVDYLDMGRGLFPANISLLFAIMLVLEAMMRTGLHFFINSKRFNWANYFFWCLAELVVISLFQALYLSLMSSGEYGYFDSLFGFCLPYTSLILIFPYLILTLSFSLPDGDASKEAASEADGSLIRFYDAYRKPKFLIAVSAILYIKAEENYVCIWFTDNGKANKYTLRASMNSIEESCLRHGLVRCQRSYFINPAHVTILRKENGWIYADLDMQGVPGIPVSKRYYDTLSNML
ncbi:MAG: LytTR family transcriptional regulator [Bacteroidales bacterium]|nr:LytTR family transcriptional regulator [Bacteroidales bacterium]